MYMCIIVHTRLYCALLYMYMYMYKCTVVRCIECRQVRQTDLLQSLMVKLTRISLVSFTIFRTFSKLAPPKDTPLNKRTHCPTITMKIKYML